MSLKNPQISISLAQGLQMSVTYLAFEMEFLGTDLACLCYQSKYCKDWVISPADTEVSCKKIQRSLLKRKTRLYIGKFFWNSRIAKCTSLPVSSLRYIRKCFKCMLCFCSSGLSLSESMSTTAVEIHVVILAYIFIQKDQNIKNCIMHTSQDMGTGCFCLFLVRLL